MRAKAPIFVFVIGTAAVFGGFLYFSNLQTGQRQYAAPIITNHGQARANVVFSEAKAGNDSGNTSITYEFTDLATRKIYQNPSNAAAKPLKLATHAIAAISPSEHQAFTESGTQAHNEELGVIQVAYDTKDPAINMPAYQLSKIPTASSAQTSNLWLFGGIEVSLLVFCAYAYRIPKKSI